MPHVLAQVFVGQEVREFDGEFVGLVHPFCTGEGIHRKGRVAVHGEGKLGAVGSREHERASGWGKAG